ncbi:MAG: hypothetical protein IJ608_11485 [Lachnospiraceae bacterium]|nr:hypothetical protein [Lachnospiraceae bacterium]
MTLQQQAYKKIDSMSDEGIRFFLDFIDKVDNLRVFTVDTNTVQSDNDSVNAETDSTGTQNLEDNKSDDFFSFVDTLSPDEIASLSKVQKRKLFLQSGGRIDFDENAYWDLRERSVL